MKDHVEIYSRGGKERFRLERDGTVLAEESTERYYSAAEIVPAEGPSGRVLNGL